MTRVTKKAMRATLILLDSWRPHPDFNYKPRGCYKIPEWWEPTNDTEYVYPLEFAYEATIKGWKTKYLQDEYVRRYEDNFV